MKYFRWSLLISVSLCLMVLALLLASCRPVPAGEKEKLIKGKVIEKEAPPPIPILQILFFRSFRIL